MALVDTKYGKIDGEIAATSRGYPADAPQYENDTIGHDLHKYLIVENTGATNSLSYQVLVRDRLDTGDRILSISGDATRTVAAGGYDEVPISANYSLIKVRATSTDGTDYSIRMTSTGRQTRR